MPETTGSTTPSGVTVTATPVGDTVVLKISPIPDRPTIINIVQRVRAVNGVGSVHIEPDGLIARLPNWFFTAATVAPDIEEAAYRALIGLSPDYIQVDAVPAPGPPGGVLIITDQRHSAPELLTHISGHIPCARTPIFTGGGYNITCHPLNHFTLDAIAASARHAIHGFYRERATEVVAHS